MKRLIPSFLTAAALLLGIASNAQSDVVHVLRSDAPIDGIRAKLAVEAIKGLDPQGATSWDADILKVRLNSAISAQALLATLNQGVARYTMIHGDARSGMPLRIDTGDPAGDDLRYEQAKAAWLQQQSQAQPLTPQKQ